MNLKTGRVRACVVAPLLAVALLTMPAAMAAGCGPNEHSGGDWPM